MANDLPLAGLNIAVTRPRGQAAQLVQDIERLGGRCIQFPLLEITPLADGQALRALLARLNEFHLAIFISPNAVRYGMEAISSAGGLPENLQIAAIGSSSAQALLDCGATKVIAPQQQFDSESLLELPELQDVSNKRVVIFRGDSGRELLGDTLALRGAHVEYATCYHRNNPQYNVSALLDAKPDALIISSSEALGNLWKMLDAPNREQLTAMPLFVSHSRIAVAASELGWRTIITAAAGDKGVLSELLTWADLRKSKPWQPVEPGS